MDEVVSLKLSNKALIERVGTLERENKYLKEQLKNMEFDNRAVFESIESLYNTARRELTKKRPPINFNNGQYPMPVPQFPPNNMAFDYNAHAMNEFERDYNEVGKMQQRKRSRSPFCPERNAKRHVPSERPDSFYSNSWKNSSKSRNMYNNRYKEWHRRSEDSDSTSKNPYCERVRTGERAPEDSEPKTVFAHRILTIIDHKAKKTVGSGNSEKTEKFIDDSVNTTERIQKKTDYSGYNDDKTQEIIVDSLLNSENTKKIVDDSVHNEKLQETDSACNSEKSKKNIDPKEKNKNDKTQRVTDESAPKDLYSEKLQKIIDRSKPSTTFAPNKILDTKNLLNQLNNSTPHHSLESCSKVDVNPKNVIKAFKSDFDVQPNKIVEKPKEESCSSEIIENKIKTVTSVDDIKNMENIKLNHLENNIDLEKHGIESKIFQSYIKDIEDSKGMGDEIAADLELLNSETKASSSEIIEKSFPPETYILKNILETKNKSLDVKIVKETVPNLVEKSLKISTPEASKSISVKDNKTLGKTQSSKSKSSSKKPKEDKKLIENKMESTNSWKKITDENKNNAVCNSTNNLENRVKDDKSLNPENKPLEKKNVEDDSNVRIFKEPETPASKIISSVEKLKEPQTPINKLSSSVEKHKEPQTPATKLTSVVEKTKEFQTPTNKLASSVDKPKEPQTPTYKITICRGRTIIRK